MLPAFARLLSGIALLLCLLSVRDSGGYAERAVLTRYGSVPKGVILEEEASGFEPVSRAAYDPIAHEFVLDGSSRYAPPLSPEETAAVLRSLDADDRLGVSIVLGEKRIVYGSLGAESPLARSLFAVDVFLVSVAFGWRENLEGVALPEGYRPLRAGARTRGMVCFSRFDGYAFEKRGGRYQRSRCRLELTLVPMGRGRAADGGYLPDFEALRRNEFEPADLANVREIHRNAEAYLRLPVVSRPAAIGEVAAVARHLRQGGVDLAALAKEISASGRPAGGGDGQMDPLERRLVEFSRNAPDPDSPAP